MKDSTVVVNAMNTILSVPGNTQCADCSGTDVQWASINLGIALCIECSGVHRGLGVHVSKVRSLNLDKWDSSTVQVSPLCSSLLVLLAAVYAGPGEHKD